VREEEDRDRQDPTAHDVPDDPQVLLVALDDAHEPRHTQELPELEQAEDLRGADLLALVGICRVRVDQLRTLMH